MNDSGMNTNFANSVPYKENINVLINTSSNQMINVDKTINPSSSKKSLNNFYNSHNNNLLNLNNLQHSLNINHLSSLNQKTISLEQINSSYIIPLTKNLETLKSAMLRQEKEYNNEISQIKEKNQLLIEQRDIEIKSFTENLINNNSELIKENNSLKIQIKLWKDKATEIELRLNSYMKNNGYADINIESKIKSISDKANVKMKELENTFDLVIKNMNFQTFTTNMNNNPLNIEEQIFIYENKIKLIYEEMFMKDKQIINLEQKNSCLNEELGYLKNKLMIEKELMLKQMEEIEKNDNEEYTNEIFRQINTIKEAFELKITSIESHYKNIVKMLKEDNLMISNEMNIIKICNNNFSIDIDNLSKENSSLKIKLEDHLSKFNDIINNYDHLLIENKYLNKENEDYKEKVDLLTSKIGGYINSNVSEKEIRKEIEEQYKDLIKTLSINLDAYSGEIKRLKDMLDKTTLRNDRNDSVSKIMTISKELDEYKEEIKHLKEKNNEIESYLVNEKRKVYEQEAKINSLNNLVSELEKLKEFKSEALNLRLVKDKLENEIDILKTNINQLDSKYQTLNIDYNKENNRLKTQINELVKNLEKNDKSKNLLYRYKFIRK